MRPPPQNKIVLSVPHPAGIADPRPNQSSQRASWLAHLRLGYEHSAHGTQLTRRSHVGPLTVQKALYPEGRDVCHSLILHPPGGIAGNDTLAVDLDLSDRAHVLITMPGAAKWYRTTDAPALQQLDAKIGKEATLEWLPPETIVFDRAAARMHTSIELAGGAYLGWEVLCLGRTLSGEKYDAGSIRQATQISLNGELLWSERCHLHGGSRLLNAAAGLGGATVSGIFIAAGKTATAETVAQCRDIPLAQPARSGITAMPNILIARYLGVSSEQAKCYFVALWRVLRPFFAGREAVAPRIWTT